MTPQDFVGWTREDWQTFDQIRQKAFEPTPEEIEAQKKAEHEYKVNYLVTVLTPYWPYEFVMPVTEEEWQNTFKLYIYGPYGDLKEWIGEDLDRFYDTQMIYAQESGGDYFEIFFRMVSQLEG